MKPRTRGRLASAILALVFGPPIAGVILGLMLVLMEFGLSAHPKIAFDRDLFVGLLPYVAFSTVIGVPLAAIALLVGRLFFTKGEIIPLTSVLLATLLALLIGGALLALIPDAPSPGASLPVMMLFVSIPALASATLCWWSTRRWHSARTVS